MLSPQTLMASQAKGSPSTPLPGRAWSPALGPPQDPPLWTVLPTSPQVQGSRLDLGPRSCPKPV